MNFPPDGVLHCVFLACFRIRYIKSFVKSPGQLAEKENSRVPAPPRPVEEKPAGGITIVLRCWWG